MNRSIASLARSSFRVPSLALALALATACSHSGPGVQADVSGAESAQTSAGRVGSHGMVVAGTVDEAFLSHIPMFQAPHDVQLVVAGAFSSLEPSRPLPASFSDELFTFLPDRMSLDQLRSGALTELHGTLFAGNFESGGRPVPGRVRFRVTRVIHEHVLASGVAGAGGGGGELTYFVFGSRAHTLAVHRLTVSPGFDEALRVTLTGQDAPD